MPWERPGQEGGDQNAGARARARLPVMHVAQAQMTKRNMQMGSGTPRMVGSVCTEHGDQLSGVAKEGGEREALLES